MIFACMLTATFSSALFARQYHWLTKYDTSNALNRRISAPPGFQRVETSPGSFGEWLQRLPLKPGKPDVFLYNGIEKRNQTAHFAVVDMDVGKSDLQQCADAVIRLRAEFLYSQHRYRDIEFDFTSGDAVHFNSWIQGYRPIVKNNTVVWVNSGDKGASYNNFRRYLTQIFIYAGSASLAKQLHPVKNIADMQIGDVFIQGGFPGHAVIVADMAVQPDSGKKVFLLAQSFMPAQDVHILVNPNDAALSPWYSLDFGEILITPEWRFNKSDLMRF